jgi:DNA primase
MQNTDIIKDKLNIVDVVGSYVKLEKSGKTYKGKSPFTHEKTPSFFVSPEKGFFYCFSSGKGGDIFTFIQEIERVDFKDALKILAEKAGIVLEKTQENVEEITRTHIQYKILDDTTKWYEVHLRKNPLVVNHLLQRGLSKETMIKYRLGFALDSWHDIYDYLKSRKYRDEDIAAVGLVIQKDTGGYYDRFRSRIMFPLFDTRGRVVGFSGRIFGQETESTCAKYINSPEGPLFNKSKVLYGYHLAKSMMSKEDACILVEGQFDVLMAQQSGYIHTVAISGTGLTDDHVMMIKRFTDNIVLALDSDKAGIKATRRSVLSAYTHGMNVQVIIMPEGMDPADTIVKSKSQWDVCVRDAKDYLDYRLELAHREEKTFEEKKSLIDNDLFTFVALTKSAMVQDKMLQKLSLFLGVSIEAVRNDFAIFKPEELSHPTLNTPVPEKPLIISSMQENILYFALYINDKKIAIDSDVKKKQQDLYHDIYLTDLEKDIQAIPEITKNLQLFILEDQLKEMTQKALKEGTYKSLVQEKKRILEKQSIKLLEKIRQAESKKDIQMMKHYMQEQQELLKLKTDLTNNL